MRPIIPKSPEVPKEFSDKEISFLTKSVFGEIIEPQPCDVLFVFSGTHPGHWEKAIETYQKGYVRRIIVTGGRSLTGASSRLEWPYRGRGYYPVSAGCGHS